MTSISGREDTNIPAIPALRNEKCRWFVLTTLDPRDAEEQLRRENIRRDNTGYTTFKYVVPAQMLKHRTCHEADCDSEDSMYGAEPSGNQERRLSVRQNNEIRAALRRYLFIFGRERDIDKFLDGSWNKNHHNRIQFFHDAERKRAFVPVKTMEEFIAMLADRRLSFELTPALGDLRKGEPVMFRNKAFAGRTAYVVDSRRTRSGNVVTVELDLIGNTLRLKVHDVRDEDIIRLDAERSKHTRNSDLIKYNQKHLMDILSRRINGKETEKSRMDDALTLNNMYATRFRHFGQGETAAYRHFIAQMLVCACLRHDRQDTEAYTEKVLAELADIDRAGESKAATDTRARIHAALFLATGKPEYRAMARTYVRDKQPKSEKLRTLVRMISKRQTLKSI